MRKLAPVAFAALLPLSCYPVHPKPDVPMRETITTDGCVGVVVTQPQYETIVVHGIIDGVEVRADASLQAVGMTDTWLFRADPSVAHPFTIVFEDLIDGSRSWRQVGLLPACVPVDPDAPTTFAINGPADP